MDFNFFEWIRQGVKRSVLMGVTDAVECLGTPVEQDKVRETLLAYAAADETGSVDSSPRLTGPGMGGARTPAKLGRRLSDSLKRDTEPQE